MSYNVAENLNSLLPYNDKLENRQLNEIELLVIHCTELPDIKTARIYGEKVHYSSGTGNSGHYYISKKGELFQWVELDRVAHHVKDFNRNSIGVELDNLGRFPNWHKTTHQYLHDSYPKEQILALIELILKLQKKLPNLKFIAGHEELDTRLMPSENSPDIYIRRKMDPGYLFPWDEVLKNINLEKYK
ncbi:MAG: N-acetylmuramoyl-L-alanine amidase [Xanthomonadales bacterium]|nr:N-acetylmuramoyl-L-alanine amidase [Xanthomonadales bacterium]